MIELLGHLAHANFIRKGLMGEEVHPALLNYYRENLQDNIENGGLTDVADKAGAVVESSSDFLGSVGGLLESVSNLLG